MGASQISNDAFAQALRDSIDQAGLFAKVSTEGARYRLTGFIGKVDQPMIGFSMTVKMEVSYALKDTQSGNTVWTRDINSEYTAKASAAFAPRSSVCGSPMRGRLKRTFVKRSLRWRD